VGGCRFPSIFFSHPLFQSSVFAVIAVCNHALSASIPAALPLALNPQTSTVQPDIANENLIASEVTNEKITVTKVVGDKINLVPRFSKVGGDASHARVL